MHGRRDAMNAAREALSGRADTIEGPTPTLRRETAALRAWRVAMQGLSPTVKGRRAAVALQSATMFEKSPKVQLIPSTMPKLRDTVMARTDTSKASRLAMQAVRDAAYWQRDEALAGERPCWRSALRRGTRERRVIHMHRP